MKRGCDSRSFLALRVVALLIVSIFLILSTGIVSAVGVTVSGIVDGTMTGCENLNTKYVLVAERGSKFDMYIDSRDCFYAGKTSEGKGTAMMVYDGTEWAFQINLGWNTGFLYTTSNNAGINFGKNNIDPSASALGFNNAGVGEWMPIFDKSVYMYNSLFGSIGNPLNGCNITNAKVIVEDVRGTCPIGDVKTNVQFSGASLAKMDMVYGEGLDPIKKALDELTKTSTVALRSDSCDIFLGTYSSASVKKKSDGVCEIAFLGDNSPYSSANCPGKSVPIIVLRYDKSKSMGNQFSGGVFY
ncbi:MAG: hypothetical protein WCP89_01130, partial [archaeon]